MKKSNPKSLENLKRGNRFVKGQSGNPKGRPKKLPSLEAALISVLGEIKDDKNAMEAIVMALRNKAIKGDVRAAEVLMERGYGKIKDVVDINSDGVTTLRIIRE
mgnify:CR=1 FL=1